MSIGPHLDKLRYDTFCPDTYLGHKIFEISAGQRERDTRWLYHIEAAIFPEKSESNDRDRWQTALRPGRPWRYH